MSKFIACSKISDNSCAFSKPTHVADRKEARKEAKIERKLEKLDNKTTKLKKKMSLLRSSDSEGTSKNTFDLSVALKENEVFDAAPTGKQCSNLTVPHMSGGESYQQQWEVVNVGEASWTSKVR